MTTTYHPKTQQPIVAKYVQPERSGILSHNQTRHGIGFIIRGTKYIYNGDSRQQISRGEMFYLGPGSHYTEDMPENGHAFEQIVFYYTPDQLCNILSYLSMTYGLNIENNHSCPNCREKSHVIYPSWNAARFFFNSANHYFNDGIFESDTTIESLKLTELIYLVISHSECCLKTKILENSDIHKESFEQLIQQNIFNDISIDALAQLCNRSLTSFKKEFKRHFFEPPHKWFIRQRLMHARLLLISTSKSIAEIGNKCNFPNTSHFIKLFKKEYSITPAAYRNKHARNKPNNDPLTVSAAVTTTAKKKKVKA